MFDSIVIRFMPHNALELSCPAEAGKPGNTLRLAGGQDKQLRMPSPPGQLQRVVMPPGFNFALLRAHAKQADVEV